MTKELFHLRQFRLLLLVLLCALFSLPLSAQEAYVQKSEDQHTLTFYYDNNRKLRGGITWDIDETYDGSTPVWTFWKDVVTKVVFDSSFKDFRPTTTEGWFYKLSALNTIEGLENLNTSAVTNMREMFLGCHRLTSLNLSNFNTSKVTDMNSMFSSCSSLTELNVSNFNTSKVTNMREMFNGCSSLTELNVSNFNTSKATNMGYMFYGCSSLTELNLSNFNTSKVTYMSEMFFGCSGLTSLNLSNFKTSKVTNMSEMFSDCSGLKELNVSNFNTSKVTDMWGMFKNCSGLKELNVSNFNTSAVWNMWGMFKNCSGLKELNVSNFNTSAVTDMRYMFFDCSCLKTILNPNIWRCEKSQKMFRGCTQLKGAVEYDKSKVDVTMANPTTGYFTAPNRKEAYVLQSEDQHTLTFYYDNNRKLRGGTTWDINEKSISLNPVWAGTYYTPNNAVTKVVFDASFKDFLSLTTNSWFSDLKALTTIEGLQNLNTSEVTDMRNMFSGCSSLTELNVSNFNTSKVTDMSLMFYDCSGLKELNVSNFNTSAVESMSDMFFGCSGLKELNVSNFNTSAVEFMSGMFSGCSGLKELNVSNFNTSAVESMSGMFSGCSGLTSLNLSNFNISEVWNMSYMFSGCSGLKTILNPNIWRCEQSQNMFKGCTQLKGAVKYDASKVDATMANPTTGYFSWKLPTAIGRVVFDDNNATQIYNLQGKRVNGNQRHLPAGFYIVNGKKVYLNEKP